MQHQPSTAGKGVKHGLDALKHSVVDGVKGVSEKPAKELRDNGKRAAAKGVAKGMAGYVV